MYKPSKKYGFVKTNAYRNWIKKNLPIVENAIPVIEQFPIEIEIKIVEGYGFHKFSDIQNVNKAVVDLIVKAKKIPDDNTKYVIRCEEKFIPFWTKKSEAITMVKIILPYN